MALFIPRLNAGCLNIFCRAFSSAKTSVSSDRANKSVENPKLSSIGTENIVIRWPPGNRSDALLCWHPEKEHPYEHTLPVQHDSKALALGESVLHQDYVAQSTADHVRRITRSHGPNWKTLGKVLNDDWHQFRPTPRLSATKDLLPVPPPEREGELPR